MNRLERWIDDNKVAAYILLLCLAAVVFFCTKAGVQSMANKRLGDIAEWAQEEAAWVAETRKEVESRVWGQYRDTWTRMDDLIINPGQSYTGILVRCDTDEDCKKDVDRLFNITTVTVTFDPSWIGVDGEKHEVTYTYDTFPREDVPCPQPVGDAECWLVKYERGIK